MINIGIAGAGNIARVHTRALAQMPDARIVAIADINRSKAEALAAPFAARVYADWQDLLYDTNVHVVDICLPTFLHAEAVIAAAQKGKHILCEKPLALTLEQADCMIAAVQAAGVRSMVAQVIRFWPHYLAVKKLFDEGELGRPIMTYAARLASRPTWSTWILNPQLSGGALLDLHIHDLDWLFYLYGCPNTVYALGLKSQEGTWNQVLTSLDYGDFKAAAEASFLMPDGFPFTMILRLLGDKGYAEYRYLGQQRDPRGAATAHSLVVYKSGQQPQYPACEEADPYYAEIRYFLDCLSADREPAIATLTEARTVLEIALAARRSLETGQVVPLR